MAKRDNNRKVRRGKADKKPADRSKPSVKVHYPPVFIIEPREPVTISVVGVGGTGSQVISYLARMNLSLLAMGHPGIYVTAYDDKDVTDVNVARQLFFEGEIGTNKAVTMIQRINRLFGFRWLGIPEKYGTQVNHAKHNIMIGCVDDMEARRLMLKVFNEGQGAYNEHHSLYYIDAGNSRDSGQILVQSRQMKQPPSKYHTVDRLPNIEEEFGKQIWDIKDDGQPSCSIAAALANQDLYINAFMAANAVAFVWKILREHILTVRGVYVNLSTMTTNPIPV